MKQQRRELAERRARSRVGLWTLVLLGGCATSGQPRDPAGAAGFAGGAGSAAGAASEAGAPGGVAAAGGAGGTEALGPVSLLPSASCAHPEVAADCAAGFCRIRAGCFVMGAPREEWGAARFSDVQVEVTLTRDFEMGQTEVTYAQWQAEGLEPPRRDILDASADCRDPQCPVSNVSLFDALSFANRYSERRGLPPCYELGGCVGTLGAGPRCRAPTPNDAFVCEGGEDQLDCQTLRTTASSPYECTGYRLPTEAEWEYAVRAGTATAFWTGGISPEPQLGECHEEPNLVPIAWYCANSDGRARAVGEKAPNPWGLLDGLGNVREWTTDVFNGLGYGEGPLVDPLGSLLLDAPPRDLMPALVADGESARAHGFVLRGGGHALAASVTTVNDRTGVSPPERGSSISGFRLVRTLE